MTDNEIETYIRDQNKDMDYAIDEVLLNELNNYRLFAKHPEWYTSHESLTDHYKFYPLAFGKDILSGTGVMDVGCGESGAFLLEQNTKFFNPPRVGLDPYQAAVPPPAWTPMIMRGQDIVAKFGAQSYDLVQCMEALEHVPQEESNDIAKQCLQCARKYAFITSAPITVHFGPQTKAFCDRNSFMGYHGQPNVEILADIGYKIQLIDGYGFDGRAYRIFASWDIERDGPHKFM